jgi:hypothetical protein
LLAGISARSEMFEAIGYGGTTLASHSATWLGEHYCLSSTPGPYRYGHAPRTPSPSRWLRTSWYADAATNCGLRRA